MIGDRVVTPSGDVGIVEKEDDGMVGVRCCTPDNMPSCVVSWCYPNELSDGTNVLPLPRSREWKREALLFRMGVEGALREADV